MLRFILLLFLFLCLTESIQARQNFNAETVIGYVSADSLFASNVVYRNIYNAYRPESTAIAYLSDYNRPVEILAIIGTWCVDSTRNLPRFLKVLHTADNTNISATFYGLDEDKTDPAKKYRELNITHVPTFIISLDGAEAGRIVERPHINIEAHLMNILMKSNP